MNNQAEYECKFGPDNTGSYIEEVVTSSQALNCGNFCECTGFTNNQCLFGPDDKGFFYTDSAVPSEEVDTCADEWCLCDKHADVIA